MGDLMTQYQFLDPLIDDEDTILAIRAKALALYAEGKTLLEWESEGNKSKKSFVAPISQILAETRMALKQGWPAKYGYPIRSSKPFLT